MSPLMNDPFVKTTLRLNPAKLKEVRAILHAGSDSEAVRMLIAQAIETEGVWKSVQKLKRLCPQANNPDLEQELKNELLVKKTLLLPIERLEKVRDIADAKSNSSATRVLMETAIAYEEFGKIARSIQEQGAFGKDWDELSEEQIGNPDEWLPDLEENPFDDTSNF
jgi:hypothetical protein